MEDAATQLSRGEMVNYVSVQDNVNEAKIELDRYRQRGFMVDVPKAIVESEMAHGTISRLGLIIKEKPEGVKRCIILDLRRSGRHRKSTLPETLVLPQPKDAVDMIRDVYGRRQTHAAEGNFARELVVIDISWLLDCYNLFYKAAKGCIRSIWTTACGSFRAVSNRETPTWRCC